MLDTSGLQLERPRKTLRTMKSIVLRAPRDAQLEEIALPEPKPGEARVRVEGTGLCGSNLPLWQGRPWFQYPLEPGQGGHEGYGTIDALGAGDDSGFRAGDRVAFLSNHAFAEYDVTPVRALVRLPSELDGREFPAEAIACAINVFRRSAIESGLDTAIVGTGYLGLLLTQLCAATGARVIAISRRACALEQARTSGAAETIRIEEGTDVRRRVEELTHGAMCPRVIEATGAAEPLELASTITGVRGRLVVAGYHQDGRRSIDMQSWNWRGIDVINAHERDASVVADGMRASVEAVVSKKLDPFVLHTHVFPLERIAEAFAALEERPTGFVKSIVTVGRA
jgi:threonine dehydrogenase-like Zn-dependent dehydrogenase